MPKYMVTIKKEACMGCGTCKSICPENFAFDIEENKAKVKKKIVTKLGCNKEAANACPAGAIDVREIK